MPSKENQPLLGAVVQALQITLLGIAAGLVAGFVRGFPQLPPEAASCGGGVEEAAPRWISQTEAKAMYGDPAVVFLDARSEEEFLTGHITNAMHVSLEAGTLPAAITDELRGARTLIAYCDTSEGCTRSTRLASLLTLAGMRDVRVLEGGIPRWIALGYPAEAGPCTVCEP